MGMPVFDTNEEFLQAFSICRNVFSRKLKDYGTAWRIMRIPSVTDQVFIKASRLRSVQESGIAEIVESPVESFVAIVNYCIIGLIQLSNESVLEPDMTYDEAIEAYDRYANQCFELMKHKNHDYGEAWRGMRVGSYVDMILMKLYRTKQIEDNNGRTLVSEGIDANYMDMINYSIFGIIRLELEKQ